MTSAHPTGDRSADPDRHGHHDADPDAEHPAPPTRQLSWTTRLILGFVVLVSMVAGWFIATAFLPRWWAQRVADVVDRSFSAGLFAGLTCGVVFTAGPLLLLRPALRRRVRWGVRLGWLVVAALVAVPNLTTLGIVLGSNNAAHAGQRIMDVEAPWFRGATLAGAVLGALGVVLLWMLLASRRRRTREVQQLRSELRRREEADAAHDDEDRDDRDDLHLD